MGGRSRVRRGRTAVGVAVLGALVMAGCNLGVAPVTYELKDPDQFDFPLGSRGVASGDIDADGDTDVVAVGNHGYAVLVNDGTGTLTIDFPPVPPVQTESPSLVDIDNDTDLDLVGRVPTSPSSTTTRPAVRRNDGAGNFGPLQLVSTVPPGALRDLVTADADGDGDVDLLAVHQFDFDRHVLVYLYDGTGTFGPPTTYPFAFSSDDSSSAQMVTGDLEGDGDVDVVVTESVVVRQPGSPTDHRTVALVARNDGTGAFTGGGPIDVGPLGTLAALHPALADLDADGNLDLAVGGTASITTLLGDGAGGFDPPQTSLVPDTHAIDRVVPTDIDQDGHVDLVGFDDVLSAESGVVVYGDGDGGVADRHTVGTGTDIGDDGTIAVEVEILDLEGDGDPDILFLAGSLGVLENATNGHRPTH